MFSIICLYDFPKGLFLYCSLGLNDLSMSFKEEKKIKRKNTSDELVGVILKRNDSRDHSWCPRKKINLYIFRWSGGPTSHTLPNVITDTCTV